MSDETKIFTKNDKNGDKCASGGQESGLKLIFERGVAILVRPWRFPGQPKKFVFFSIKVGTINSGTSLDSREQFKKTGKLEHYNNKYPLPYREGQNRIYCKKRLSHSSCRALHFRRRRQARSRKTAKDRIKKILFFSPDHSDYPFPK